ncbi:MAG: class I SAM-dependent methyltransferase [Anaerolineae bacterium]|nr:class I SAM-dependent methyltransferase [Candidatus Roseilinea sp.]MDW8448423.1 class I SAM-dependent methyltransferase [Anaerolineae bacterium]
MRWLYDHLAPPVIRRKIYTAHARRYVSEFAERELQFEEAIPCVELGVEHIANLQVLTSREAMISRLPSQGVVAELGVWRGDFSAQILSITQPSRLYLIDPWDLLEPAAKKYADFVQQRFEKESLAGQVIIRRGYSVAVLEDFDDHHFDWVYIDSDHTYETTKKELEVCRVKVKPGGIIAGHDYTKGDWKANGAVWRR